MITLPETPQQDYYLDKSIFFTHNSNYSGEDMPDGMDYQGIQWKTNMRHLPRKTLRQHRNASYKPFRQFREKLMTRHPLKHIKKEEPFYSFEKFYKISDLWYGHFQLKDNLMVPTKTDLLYPYCAGFIHYSLLNFKEKKFSFPGNVHPVGMDYYENIVGLSTLDGSLILHDLRNDKLLVNRSITNDNSINNCINFFKQKDANHLKMCCGSNDNYLQIFDLYMDLKPELKLEMDSPVNYIKPSPDGKLLLVLSDQEEADIIDPRSGKTIIELQGHEDYGFSGDWHPDGHYLATGNQDCTCRVWDIRKPDREVNILQTHLGSVSTVKYSPTGSFLAVGENIDFVNIYNADCVYEEMQVIDFFGEVTGVNFDGEDGESLMFGVMLNGYNGVFEYNIKKTEHLSVLSNFMF